MSWGSRKKKEDRLFYPKEDFLIFVFDLNV